MFYFCVLFPCVPFRPAFISEHGFHSVSDHHLRSGGILCSPLPAGVDRNTGRGPRWRSCKACGITANSHCATRLTGTIDTPDTSCPTAEHFSTTHHICRTVQQVYFSLFLSLFVRFFLPNLFSPSEDSLQPMEPRNSSVHCRCSPVSFSMGSRCCVSQYSARPTRSAAGDLTYQCIV